MESASESDGSRGAKAILRSPTVIFSLVLVAVYIIIGAIVGNFFEPIQLQNIFVDLVVQCDVPTPIFPWTVLTAIFLHASILHIASNVFFLLFFGFILEEQVSKSRWVTTFFVTGMVGSLGFVGYDLLVYSLAPNAFVPDCAVGASGTKSRAPVNLPFGSRYFCRRWRSRPPWRASRWAHLEKILVTCGRNLPRNLAVDSVEFL